MGHPQTLPRQQQLDGLDDAFVGGNDGVAGGVFHGVHGVIGEMEKFGFGFGVAGIGSDA